MEISEDYMATEKKTKNIHTDNEQVPEKDPDVYMANNGQWAQTLPQPSTR